MRFVEPCFRAKAAGACRDYGVHLALGSYVLARPATSVSALRHLRTTRTIDRAHSRSTERDSRKLLRRKQQVPSIPSVAPFVAQGPETGCWAPGAGLCGRGQCVGATGARQRANESKNSPICTLYSSAPLRASLACRRDRKSALEGCDRHSAFED
jgi:hypothetical protein